jgi:hypothetical protein
MHRNHHADELPAPWLVRGTPVGYSSGAAEQAWKAQIMSAVPLAPAAHAGDGLLADFRVAPPTAKSPGFDLDNMLDPVFSVVINGRGWFGGHRANLRWVAARKAAGETGVHLAVLEDPPRPWGESGAEVGLDDVYHNQLPSPAAIEDYTTWVQSHMLGALPGGPVGIEIDFTDDHVNLGDVGTGRAKVLIDGMWPVLGSKPGAPDDGRVAALILRKGIADLGGTVAIRVVRLPRTWPTAHAVSG